MRKHALLRITPYIKRQAHWLVLAIVLAFIEIGFELRIPKITGDVIDGPILKGTPGLLPMVGLLAAFGLIETTLAFVRRNILAKSSYKVETQIRNDLYAHLQKLHVGFHDGWQSGQLLSRAIQDIGSLRRFIGFGFPFLIILTVEFGLVLFALFRIHTGLAILSTVVILPVAFISNTFGKRYRVISRRIQDEQGDLGTIIEEAATGIRIIKAFGRAPLMSSKFRKQAEKLRGSNLDWVKLAARLWPTFDIFPNAAKLLVALIGGSMVIRGQANFSIGTLFEFMTYVQMLIWPLDALGWILAMTEESRTATERLFEVFDTEPEIKDREGASTIKRADGRIAMDDVWFRYDGTRDWVLKGVSLNIEPGETLALVGRTGSGKTTLAMLIPRLYDAVQGKVTLDETDVRDLTLASLRAQIGVAFEDPILFSASVKENLIMGRPHSTDEEIASALKTAQAEFVYELPWSLDTRVGEQGYTLSGGQRQRLALARAVLGGPQVLVLDDPLSSVDVHTEAMIEEALATVLQGVTAILVAHRPSTLALSDRVALLEEGRIAAIGTHHDLMASDPLYRAVLSQEAEELEGEEVTSRG